MTYDVLTQSNPKKAKVAYQVDFGHLWTLDSMAYLNFPAKSKQFIDASMNKALIRKGSPFNVANMESERQRITRPVSYTHLFNNIELQYRLNEGASQYIRAFYNNNTLSLIHIFQRGTYRLP